MMEGMGGIAFAKEFPLIGWRVGIVAAACLAGGVWVAQMAVDGPMDGWALVYLLGAAGLVVLGLNLIRQLLGGQPALRLSADGVTGFAGGMKRLTIPWSELGDIYTVNGNIMVRSKKDGMFSKRKQIHVFGFTSGLSHKKVLAEIENFASTVRTVSAFAPSSFAAPAPQSRPAMPAAGVVEREGPFRNEYPSARPAPAPMPAGASPAARPAFAAGQSRAAFGKRNSEPGGMRPSPHAINRRV